MDLFKPVSSFVGIFIMMIAATFWLRRQDILNSKHLPIISKMIVDLVYPALIFSVIAQSDLKANYILSAMSINVALLVVGLLMGMLGKYVFRLNNASLMAFILAGTFSGTSLIGSALLKIVYQDQPAIISMGIVIAQFSHGLLINTVGIFIGIHYCSRLDKISFSRQVQQFLISKPMLALSGGLAWNLLEFPTSGYLPVTLFGGLTMIGSALPFLSAMATGLAFESFKAKGMLWILVAVSIAQLVAEPMISHKLTQILDLPLVDRQVGLLLSALPASPLAVVICARYGGNTSLASAIVLFTCFLSIISLPVTALFSG
jgi:predicted permease